MAQAKRKKRFFDVDMPIIKKTTQLFGYDEEELATRYIKYDLTRLLRGKNATITLKVLLKDNVLTSIPKEIYVLPSYTRRMVRKSSTYIEDSFKAPCKDSEILIKPLLVTRRIIPNSIRKALREKAKDEIINYLKNKSAEEIFEDVLRNSLQRELSIKLKKIYPLSACEIRWIKIVGKN